MEASQPVIPLQMKVWLVTRRGEPNRALTMRTDYPVPLRVKAGNVLIQVEYAALNPADLNLMANIPNWIPFRQNPIPGLDFVGKVVGVGASVPKELGLKVGVEVCGALGLVSVAIGRGTLAEYIEVPARNVVVKPKGITAKDAAGALGIAGQTACIVLRHAVINPGDRVLINGASGGVGTVLVQVAKAKGAVVYGVCSGANSDMVKSLGADEVIDYKAHESLTTYLSETFSGKSRHLDRIFDCVGSDRLFQGSTNYMNENGLFITIVGGVGAGPVLRSMLLPVTFGGVPRRYQLLALWPGGETAKEVAKWIEGGELKHFQTDSEFSFEEAIKGYERVASNRARGKVVIKVQSS